MKRFLLALALGASLSVPPALAQLDSLQAAPEPPAAPEAAPSLVDAGDPGRIAAILREEGHEATLKRQDTGAMEIETSAGGTRFWLYFQACDDDFTGCEVITFASGFDFETAQLPDIIGDWNANRFSKAYLDADGDPFVEFSVNMKNGVSRENFIDTLSWFIMEMDAFIERIGWNSDIAGQAQPI